MRRLIIFILSFLIIIIIGCDNKQEKISSLEYSVALDIADAKYLYTTSAQESDFSNLYKSVVEDNTITPVKFLNSELDPIDPSFFNIQVEKYFKLDENLICLTGQFELYNDSSLNEQVTLSSILIDLNNGNIFDFNGHFPENTSYYLGSSMIQKDSLNNLYYTYNGIIYKLSRLANMNYSINHHVPDGQNFNNFFIDRVGNCFYSGDTPGTIKIKKHDGGIVTSTEYFQDMFYVEDDLFAIHGNEIVKISLNPSLTLEPIDIFEFDIEKFYFAYNSNQQNFTLLLQDSYCSLNTGYYGIIYSGDQKKVFPINLEIQGYNESSCLNVEALIDNYLFLVPYEKSVVVRVDLEDLTGESIYLLDQSQIITIPEEYDIYSLKIFNQDTISIVGLNYIDEKIYCIEMDFNGNVRILSESPSENLVILEKIN